MSLAVSLAGLSLIAFLFLDVEVSVKYLENESGSGLFLEVFYFNRLWKREYSYKDFNFRLEPFLSWLSLREEVESSEGKELTAERLDMDMLRLWRSCRVFYAVLTKLGEVPALRRLFYNTILVKKVEWCTEVGRPNPMETGIQVGAGWAVKGWLISCLTRVFCVKQVSLAVRPRFDRILFQTEFACDASFKVAHILLVRWLLKRSVKQQLY